MSNPVDFSVKPFARGVLKDIPSQFMPMGGLTHGLGVRIDDAYIEKRLGFRRISDCEYDEYILGLYQYLSPDQVSHVFFGDRHHLYHIGYGPALRFWDDGYPWWDIPGYAWDALAGGVTYELSPWGSTQICPVPSITSESSSSSSTSESSSSLSSLSVSSSASCTTDHYPFTGRDHRDANGETSTWIFTDFAGNIIATNYEDPIVIIRGYVYDRYENLNCMGLRARIVDNFQSHLMALNTVDSIDGQVVNRIWWSGLDDAEDWDYTNLASESGYTDLEPSSMPITGGAKLRDSYIVYQTNMIHQMNYVGGTNIFSRQVINKEIGCMTKGLLCSDGEKHFFFAQNDIWMFDGYNFKPIGINNNEYIYGGLNKSQISRAFSFIDVNTNEAHFVIPWQSDIPNLDCIYDYMHDLWTFDFLDVNGCEGATAGCPKVAFDFPFIARVGSRISSSASVSSSSSSSCSISSSSKSSSSSTSHSSQSRQECIEVGVDCDCPDYYDLVVSGLSGTCECSPNNWPCTDMNGTHRLTKIPGDCIWLGSTPLGLFDIDMRCVDGYWVITFSDYDDSWVCLTYTLPHYDLCPPTGELWDPQSEQDCCDGRLSEAYLLDSSTSSSSSSSMSYTCGNDMVVNGNFESWTTPQAPEHWTLNYSGPPFAGSVNQNAAEQTDGLYSARVGHTMAAATNWTEIYQDIGIHKPITYWQGATVTLTAWVKCAVALKAEIFIDDGVSKTMSFPHPGDDQWHLLTVTRTIDAAALYVRAELWVEADPLSNISASFDSVWATEECSGSSSSQSSSSFSNSSSSTSGSNSSSSSKSSSQSSSSDSFSSEGAHADSFIEEVGSTLNDDGWPRVSEWISGEYTTFNPEVPIDQYIKEIREITPVITDIANDVHISLGARDRTDTATVINWETLAAFTQQELVGTTTYGRYLSFKCVASSLDDYYEISELLGSYVVAGRR